MKNDISKVRKSFSLFWMIGALVLMLFASRTGAALSWADVMSAETVSPAPSLVAESHPDAITTSRNLD
ncbi:MAG: hypothetical protein ACR2QU_10425 [Gammaproteobacteria bacterium]